MRMMLLTSSGIGSPIPAGAPDCASARCSMDAGCRRAPDGSYICICTHDLSPPRPDGSCPRNVVTQFPNHSDFPTKKTFITIRTNSNEGPSSDSTVLLSWLLPTLVGIFIILAILLWLRWRHKKLSGNASSSEQDRNLPVPLQTDLLNRDRFTSNPQYDQSLPPKSSGEGLVLLREWIDLEEEIGQGCFGKVYRGRYRRPGASSSDPPVCDETVAVKVLKASSSAGQGAERDLFREARIMAEFSHPNILAVRGVVINEGSIGPWLVFEFMSLGDLAQLLRTDSMDGSLVLNPIIGAGKTSRFDQDDLLSVAEQIAAGMVYLSSQRFVHRDLACRNCLVGERLKGQGGFSSMVVKISDFGMSRDVYTTDYYTMGGTQMLPVRWMSPESVLYGKFTTESDVWSYGVLLWEVFTMGIQPYYGHSNEEVIQFILNGILLIPPESTPPLICRLLYGCWKSRPSDRLTFLQIHEQLTADQRQKRRSHCKRQSSVGSYISVTAVNDALAEVIASSCPTSADAIKVTLPNPKDTDDYLLTLPDSPKNLKSISTESSV